MANSAFCGECGKTLPKTMTACYWCGSKLPGPAAEIKLGAALDTQSFVIPTGKRIVLVWIVVSIVLPLMMSAIYALLHYIW